MPRPWLLLVGVSFAVQGAAPFAGANTNTWSGGYPLSVNGDWTTPNNWVGQSVPASGASLVFGPTTSGGSNQTTSNNNIANPFIVGPLTFAAGAPAYTLSGGALNVNTGGIVQNSANAQTINNSITIGTDQTWVIGDGSGALNLGANVLVNYGLTLGGGTINAIGSDIKIEDNSAAGAASLTLSGAALSPRNVYVGYARTGSVTQSAGSVTVAAGRSLYIAYNAGSSGVYRLSGGSLTLDYAYVGDAGSGTFIQSGGTFGAFDTDLYVGYSSSASGSYDLSGGSVTTYSTWVSTAANTSSFSQSAGMHTTSMLSLTATVGNSHGAYHLNGGTLRAGTVKAAAGANNTSTFNFNGGTLQARQNNATFFEGLTNTNVQSGGAKIDTAGFDVTVAQPLVHDTTTGAPALDGGLTKLGAGTLTLTGANTYTGATTVAGGILSVSSDGLLGAAGSPVIINNGGVLQFTTANITTARSFVLNAGAGLAPPSGGTLSYASGAAVSGGALGAGNHAFSDGTSLNGSRATTGAVLSQSAFGTVGFNDVTLSANSTFTQGTSALLNVSGDFVALPNTTITLNGLFNAAAGAYLAGSLTINNTGKLYNTAGPLYLDGTRGVTINSGGQLNAATGSTIELGGLLTNNGSQTGQLNINLGAIVRGSGSFGNVHVTATGSFGATGTIAGSLVVDSGALVTLNGAGTLTVNGAVTNNGVMRFERGAQLAVGNGAGFTNNGTLDVITGGFQVAAQGGFINNGLVLDSSVVKVKTFAYSPGGPVQVQIDGYPGHTYQLQRSNSLASGSFAAVPGVAAQTTPESNPGAVLLAFADPSPAAGMGFYRVAVDP